MGDIKVNFVARRGPHVLKGSALVDSGAQTSVIGLTDACQLGLNVARAEKVDRKTVGGMTLTGLRLRGVLVTANKRQALLDDVFVPVAQETKTPKGKSVRRLVPRDEPTLLGQDFLQGAKAFLDFSDDTLRGVETLGPPVSLSRRYRQRPASKQHRELIRALAVCPVPRR